MTLKFELKEMRGDEFSNHPDIDSLIERMLDDIGSTDAELRDQLIYTAFGKLIAGDYLTQQQLEHILETCRHNLFVGIGATSSDLVFTRSFSSLVIALILQKDRLRPFLQKEVVLEVFEESMKYLALEQDVRGHVDGKGWAHSIAHGADLLAETVRHPSFPPNLFSGVLKTIEVCVFKEMTAPYIDDEEERLVFVLEALIEKGISDHTLGEWVNDVSNTLQDVHRKEEFSVRFFWKRSNVINFLRGFYFRLLYKDEHLELRARISKILQQWHIHLYQPNE